jgi:histone H2A
MLFLLAFRAIYLLRTL